MSEAERRRRRAGTGPSGSAAPFSSPRTFTGHQSAGASGARQPRPESLLRSEAQVASSPGRSWTIPDLAAHRPVSWLPPHRQHAALISPQPRPPFNFFIPAPSSQALSPFVFCPLLQGCFQSCVMCAPLLCPLCPSLVLHSYSHPHPGGDPGLLLDPNFLSVRLTWEGDSLLFPALCRALRRHFGSSCCPPSQMMPSGVHPANSPWSAGTRHCQPSSASCAVCLESSTASSVRPHLISHSGPPPFPQVIFLRHPKPSLELYHYHELCFVSLFFIPHVCR